ncbi:MAG: alcohol dehydrogenase catalytic domain-containing protein, partial [Candidatus Binatia bacterium]
MRAAVMRKKKLVVDDVPVPEPGAGEVLVKTLACGICGSDLHALKHAEKLVESAERSGGPFVMDLARDIVMGHEFCAEILDHGPGSSKTLKTG